MIGKTPHKHHKWMNVLTFNGEAVNGLWTEYEDEIVISLYVDCQDKNEPKIKDTRYLTPLVHEAIEKQFKGKKIEKESGWSTKNQAWTKWKILM